MSIEIPAGVAAGQVLSISVWDGKQIEFAVPEGCKGGDSLDLWYDSASGTLMAYDAAECGDAAEGTLEQVMSIEIPAGVSAGQTLSISVPDGRQIELIVPDGKKGGDQLEVFFDPAAGTLAPLS